MLRKFFGTYFMGQNVAVFKNFNNGDSEIYQQIMALPPSPMS